MRPPWNLCRGNVAASTTGGSCGSGPVSAGIGRVRRRRWPQVGSLTLSRSGVWQAPGRGVFPAGQSDESVLPAASLWRNARLPPRAPSALVLHTLLPSHVRAYRGHYCAAAYRRRAGQERQALSYHPSRTYRKRAQRLHRSRDKPGCQRPLPRLLCV